MPKYKIKVIAKAKKDSVIKEAGGLKVHLRAPAVEGRANKALIGLLAEHFGIKKGKIYIVSGLRSRNKIVDIGEGN